jgi:hypothetical protein
MNHILFIFTLLIVHVVCGNTVNTVGIMDIMDAHSKLFGDCLMMLEKNIRDGTIKFNVTSFLSAEELCDEFAAHIVSWTN